MSAILDTLKNMEKTEKEICNFSLVFSEMFKNEINAADDHLLYVGFTKMIHKYGNDEHVMTALKEFFSAITQGAELEEIMEISIDEAGNPGPMSELTIDDSCKLK